jgi:pyridoxamine 5'-phosphate oxidase
VERPWQYNTSVTDTPTPTPPNPPQSSVSSVNPDPIARFEEIFARASVSPPMDHTAMSLATSTPAGKPSVRIVLLHGLDARGFVFYTNYEGRKGAELEANPSAALCFYWPWLDEQVRVEGQVTRLSDAESDAYFASRPRGKQIGAWASMQSRPLASREVLVDRVADVEARFAGRDVPRPPFWGGFRIAPERIEFWRAGEFRLHDREVYVREGDGWRIERLYP